MKAWIISDLHIVHQELASPPFLDIPDADLCICAGDTAGFLELGFEFLARRIAPFMPVVATLGNHDYYGSNISQTLTAAKTMVKGTKVNFLENDTIEIGDVRIVGATLWTDYEVPWGVDGEEFTLPERRDFSIEVCERYMPDFLETCSSDYFSDGKPQRLTSWELIVRHQESRAFIETALTKSFNGKTVVLTHHAPTPRSLHPRFLGHPSNGAFASDLTSVIRKGAPDFWVHGHVHHFFDYVEGHTRIICNPRGYRHEREINGFRPGFVIDL